MYCPKCGEVVSEEAKFCKRCGYPLKPEAAAAEKPAERPKGKKKKFPVFCLAAVVLCACAVLGAVFLYQTRLGKGKGALKPNEDIQKAIDHADLVPGYNLGLTPDGTILALGSEEEYVAANFIPYYQNMDLKKLGILPLGCFALTKDNQLFYKDIKIQDEVACIELCTNNVNVDGMFLKTDGSLGNLLPNQGSEGNYDKIVGRSYTIEDLNEQLKQAREEGMGDIYPEKLHGKLVSLSAENHEYLVLDEDGCLAILGADYEEWKDFDFTEWTDIAAADLALYSADTDVRVPTIAGIKQDGTLYAAGAFAEEILKWEKLSYISMSEGLIAGLTPEGKIKLTGQSADLVRQNSDVENWTDIIAVHVREEELNAMTADGTLYCVAYDSAAGYVDTAVISEEKPDASKTCYMNRDGKGYVGNDGVWKEAE